MNDEGRYWNSIRVLLSDALSLGLAFLEQVFILELGSHDDSRESLVEGRRWSVERK
jgi:hypothetical protein